MKHVYRSSLVAAAAVLFATLPASAQLTQNLTVTAAVGARATLTLSAAAINFPDSDPTTVPTITVAPLTVSARSRTTAGQAVTLTVQSGGDLMDGANSIPVANLTWAAAAPFVNGTMSTVAQTLGSWTGSGLRTGDQTYSLANSWNYAVGNYTMTVTYTLSAP